MSSPLAIGIDIGGTNTDIALIDNKGQILRYDTFSTQPVVAPYARYVEVLAEAVLNMIESVSRIRGHLVGVGIGAPNGNYLSGCVELAFNLPWEGAQPLARDLSERLHLPVILDNDANLAALGELYYGGARNLHHFVEVTLGTGVGSGIVVDGRLLRGPKGKAGELGHICVEPRGRLCSCRRRGCLEAYVSASGLVHTARLWLDQEPKLDSLLRRVSPSLLTSRHIAEAADSGDPMSRAIFDYTGQLLGKALADIACILSPEAFILFGGLTRSDSLLLDPASEAFEKHLLPHYRGEIELKMSALTDNNAALLGAAMLIMEATGERRTTSRGV